MIEQIKENFSAFILGISIAEAYLIGLFSLIVSVIFFALYSILKENFDDWRLRKRLKKRLEKEKEKEVDFI